jgi:hypothetical protein
MKRRCIRRLVVVPHRRDPTCPVMALGWVTRSNPAKENTAGHRGTGIQAASRSLDAGCG